MDPVYAFEISLSRHYVLNRHCGLKVRFQCCTFPCAMLYRKDSKRLYLNSSSTNHKLTTTQCWIRQMFSAFRCSLNVLNSMGAECLVLKDLIWTLEFLDNLALLILRACSEIYIYLILEGNLSAFFLSWGKCVCMHP